MINGYSAYIGSFVRNVSKPQTKLFDLVQRVCPYPIFNFPFYRKPRCYVIDIVVPKLELVIEYDEPYYHQDKDRDSKRQQEIEEEGWKFLRYESIPPLDQLKEDIKKVLNL
jgi:very-short-patch-repair endonuclease